MIEVFLVFSGLFTTATLMIWVERRLLGLVQERWGPNRVGPLGILQPVADVLKLLFKEDWTPPFANKAIFLLAPAVVAGTALLAFAVVPIAPEIGIADRLDVGLLFFLAMGSLAVYSAILGGWASNSKYALLGGLRTAAQSISYEVFMGLAALGVVVLAGTFSLHGIVAAQEDVWYVVYQPIGFLVFLVAGVAESQRLPFDLPEAESELVAGYHVEYSSMKFGLFFLGEYVAMVVVAAIVVTLFFGGWQGPLLPPIVWFLLKTSAFLVLFVIMRGALPRPRFDQLMAYAWKVLLPLSLLNLVVTGGVVLALEGS